jgi:hypothetical protein
MTAPLGVRVCPVLGCGRRIHVTQSGTVYARCLSHTLQLLAGTFAVQTPERARVSTPPSVTRARSAASAVAVPSRRD